MIMDMITTSYDCGFRRASPPVSAASDDERREAGGDHQGTPSRTGWASAIAIKDGYSTRAEGGGLRTCRRAPRTATPTKSSAHPRRKTAVSTAESDCGRRATPGRGQHDCCWNVGNFFSFV